MKNKNIERLEKILEKRVVNLQSIRDFDTLFFKFSKRTLKEAAENINRIIQVRTGDFMKVFYDDPFEYTNTNYFVMIQLSVGKVLKFTIKELDIEKTEKLLVDFLERVYA